MTTNENEVLNKWQNMYSIPDDVEYDDLFKEQKNYKKSLLEKDSHIINDFINKPISFQEVEQIINSLKLNKTCGFDGITNEVVKNKDVVLYLWKLFNILFDHSLMPCEEHIFSLISLIQTNIKILKNLYLQLLSI